MSYMWTKLVDNFHWTFKFK